jgi:hypothetical protein
MSETPKTKQPGFWQANRKVIVTGAILLFGCALLATALAIGMRQPDTSSSGDEVLLQVTADVVPGQALILELPEAGVSVFVPEGAITTAGFLSLVPRETNLFTRPDEGWRRPNVVNLEFYDTGGALAPNFTFTMPINICFDLDNQEWQALQATPEQFTVQFWNEESSPAEWEDLSVFPLSARGQLCGSVSHLSLFALAIQMEQEEPTEAPDVYVPPTIAPVLGDEFELALEGAGVRVVVPAEAGIFGGRLTLTQEEDGLHPEHPLFWRRSPVVELVLLDENGEAMEDTDLQNPIALCFTLDEAAWQRYLGAANDFQIQFYDESGVIDRWRSLDITELPENRELCTAVDHLTLFALARVILPTTPTPGGPYSP